MLNLTPKFAHIPAEAFTRLVLAQTRSYSKPLSLGRRAQVSQAFAAETSRPSAGSSWGYDGSPDRLVPGHSYFVTCHPGLEEIVAAELSAQHIGAQEVIPGKAGVFFRSATRSAVCRVRKASPLTLFPVMISTIAANDTRVWLLHRGTDVVGYRANLWLRSSIRVLRLLAKGPLDSYRAGGDEIYTFFRQAANWAQLLAPRQTFSIRARVTSCTDIPSSHLVQIRGRDAICDSIRDVRGSKPDPPERGQVADLPLFAALFQDECSLYLDMSGDSLHRRGYRTAMHASSLNEAAAAGVLSLANWQTLSASEGQVLADPMCGSGTFLIEAALMATNTAPGLFRQRWPFQSWPDFDPSAWHSSIDTARQARVKWDGLLLGNDVHQGALGLAKRDAKAAGISHLIKWHSGPCSQWTPRETPSTVVVNPPWGLRLLNDAEEEEEEPAEANRWFAGDKLPGGRKAVSRRGGSPGYQQAEIKLYEGTPLQAAWVDLRTFLKAQCPDALVYVLCGNPDITREIHMRSERKYPVTVGNIDCRVLKYKVLPPKQPQDTRAQMFVM